MSALAPYSYIRTLYQQADRKNPSDFLESISVPNKPGTLNIPAEILQLTSSFCRDAYIRVQAEARQIRTTASGPFAGISLLLLKPYGQNLISHGLCEMENGTPIILQEREGKRDTHYSPRILQHWVSMIYP
jgi:hypothetical protein